MIFLDTISFNLYIGMMLLNIEQLFFNKRF